MLLVAVLGLPLGGLVACASTATTEVAETRPEVRYYVIADT